jgi:uncharacterized damage-inducible protein DinB
MTPSEARLVFTAVGLPSLRIEHTITCRVLAAAPPENAEFRPAPGGRTLRELVRHIVAAELRFLEGVVEPSFPDLEVPQDVAPARDFYVDRFKRTIERLEAATGEHLLREVDYRGVLRMPALGFVSLAVNHTIHHRGQLSVYLRALGAMVPPIYG